MNTRTTRARAELARNISKAIMLRWRRGEISKKEAIKQYEELPALKGFQIPHSLREESDDLYGELEEEELSEKRKKKKKKKSGKKDACYRKVKSRYKVWPSAYASGALVKCRKVGAKNWGNSKKEHLQTIVEDELTQVLQEMQKNSLEDIIYYTLFEVLDEKKKKKGKKKRKLTAKPSSETSLRDWFGRKGAKGKKGGWVDCNTCRKDKKTGRKKCSACGRSSGEKRSKYPSCRPTPGACGKRGNWGKKSKKGKKG
jgi:hypothetical protein